MKAYAIFDGGGAKCAALCGCVEAARDAGVEFVGCGGTSAGAIIALLTAVGYSGSELRTLMTERMHPTNLVDSVKAVEHAKLLMDEILLLANSKKSRTGFLFSLLTLIFRHGPVVRSLLKRHGLFSGENISNALLSLVCEKVTPLKGHRDITFEDLERSGCIPLKIVASDVVNRIGVVFSREKREYTQSVIKAVRASSGYPFVFEPVNFVNAKLVDGGIASNLPVFIFNEERRITKYPVLAFDLITKPESEKSHYTFFHFGKDVMDTALEAGDCFLREVGDGLLHIPVEIPQSYTAMRLGLSADQINSLYMLGYESAKKVITDSTIYQHARSAGNDVQRQIWVYRGDRKLYEPPLRALAATLEQHTGAESVRTSIMLPVGDGTRIVAYHHGFREGDDDFDLRLDMHAGCTGRAMKRKQPVLANLERSREDYRLWDLTDEQQKKVAVDRNTMLSVPIYDFRDSTTVIGMLSADTSTPLQVWGEPGANIARGDVVEIMLVWSNVVGKILG